MIALRFKNGPRKGRYLKRGGKLDMYAYLFPYRDTDDINKARLYSSIKTATKALNCPIEGFLSKEFDVIPVEIRYIGTF